MGKNSENYQKRQVALEILSFFRSRKIGIKTAARMSYCYTFVIENLANDVKNGGEIGFSLGALEDWLRRLKARDACEFKK